MVDIKQHRSRDLMKKPNIIFMHSHNTGRYIQPYGFAIPAPNLQHLADSGVIFRKAFASAPTCSPSRASFLTGMMPHSCGMLGLAHRGFKLPNYSIHLAHVLKAAGYITALSGVEHTAPDLSDVGYDRILSFQKLESASPQNPGDPAQTAAKYLSSSPDQPFFLSVGLRETHRPFPKADPEHHPEEDPRFCQPPQPLPDAPETRADMADFKASVRVMDRKYGLILDALERSGLRENTYVFCFCDHGLQFPLNMCNLTDHGIGVYLIAHGPEHFTGGKSIDAMVSLMDLFPTVCALADVPIPARIQGGSLLTLVDGKADKLHDALFAEVNYHAAYEPMRCVRTERYKYIRRFDERDRLVLPNVDDTPSKDFLLAKGWAESPREQEMLYDLMFDPIESNNLVSKTSYRATYRAMSKLLDAWMKETEDPLLRGPAKAPSGSHLNDPDESSPNDPAHRVP